MSARAPRLRRFLLLPTVAGLLPLCVGCDFKRSVEKVETATRNTTFTAGHTASGLLQQIEALGRRGMLDWDEAVTGLEDKTYRDLVDSLRRVQALQADTVDDANAILANANDVLANVPGATRIPVYRDVYPQYLTAQQIDVATEGASEYIALEVSGSLMDTGEPMLSFGPSKGCEIDGKRSNRLVFSCPTEYFRVADTLDRDRAVAVIGRLSLHERRPWWAWKRLNGRSPTEKHEYELLVRVIPDVLGSATVSTGVLVRATQFQQRTRDFDENSSLKKRHKVLDDRIVPNEGFNILQDSIRFPQGWQRFHSADGVGGLEAVNVSEKGFNVSCTLKAFGGRTVFFELFTFDSDAFCKGVVVWDEYALVEHVERWNSTEPLEVRWGRDITLEFPGCDDGRRTCTEAELVTVSLEQIDGRKVVLNSGDTRGEWVEVDLVQAPLGVVILKPVTLKVALKQPRLRFKRVDGFASASGEGPSTSVSDAEAGGGTGSVDGQGGDDIIVFRTDERWEEARNAGTSAGRLEALSRHPEEDVRAGVAINPAVPFSILERLADDEDEWVRMAVASNWHRPPVGLLRRLGSDESALVRAEVAMNPNVPGDLLRELADDSVAEVRKGAAKNQKAPLELLRQLTEDVDW